MILVTGAAGKTGRAVIRALKRREAAVRALVHRPEQIRAVREAGAAEVIVGDLFDAVLLTQAMADVRAVYHIPPNMHPQEIAMGERVLQAARDAEVALFVYHSVLHPQTEKMPHHWQKLRVEERIFESGLDFVILQPTVYMQNIMPYWRDIVEKGVYRVPYAPSTRLTWVDLADVGEAAAIVLTEPGHAGAIYELCGPDTLTQDQVALILSRVLKRPVRAEKMPLEEWEARARAAGLSDYARETLKRMFLYYEAYGLWGNANVLRWLLGRSPTRLEVFVSGLLTDKAR
ncbi:MAG: NmrA/HSCARG family protein [Chloroflexi bacterium]|nr:NmrA/HSCARG family protein [Chloroflexota bacterium]